MLSKEGSEVMFKQEDGIVFQGRGDKIEKFLDECLYFCTDDPINANLNVVFEKY